MHENRATSGAPRPEKERGRSAKVQSHKCEHACARGVGLRHTIDEPGEQRRAIEAWSAPSHYPTGNAARSVLRGGAISNGRPYRDHVDYSEHAVIRHNRD